MVLYCSSTLLLVSSPCTSSVPPLPLGQPGLTSSAKEMHRPGSSASQAWTND